MGHIDGVAVTGAAYDPLFGAADARRAASLVLDLRRRGLHLSIPQHEAVVKTLLAAGEVDAALKQLFDRVHLDHVSPSMRAYGCVFEHLAAADLPERAVDVLRFMNSLGQRPDQGIYSRLERMPRYDIVLEGAQLL